MAIHTTMLQPSDQHGGIVFFDYYFYVICFIPILLEVTDLSIASLLVLNKVIPKFWVPVQISRNTILMLSLLEARVFLAPIFLPIRSGNDIVIFWSSDWRDWDTKWIICIWTLEYPYLNLNTRSDIGYRYRYNRHIKHYCVRLNLRKEKLNP